MRNLAIALGTALALVGSPWAGSIQAAGLRTMTKQEAFGPRIAAFDASLRRVDGRVLVEVTAQVLPDEAAPAVRPRKSDLTLKANERMVRAAAYRFDDRTGVLTLRLDAAQFAELSQPLHIFPQNQGAKGCALELEVRAAADRTATRRLALPPPEQLAAHLLGPQAGATFPAAAVWTDTVRLPGHGAPRAELRLVEHLRPAWSPAGAGEATIMGVVNDDLHILARDEAGVGRSAVGRAVTALPGLPEAGWPLAAQIGAGDTYVLVAGADLAILAAAAGRRVALPEQPRGAPAFRADREGVTFLTRRLALEAIDWAGRSIRTTALAPPPERGAIDASHVDLAELAPGRLLAIAAGWATNGDLSAAFLRAAVVADGKIQEASWLLDPGDDDHRDVADLRALAIGGRAYAAVSLSRAGGRAVVTRIYDLADASGLPLVSLTEPADRIPGWFLGAANAGNRLYVGRGNGGIAVFAVEARP